MHKFAPVVNVRTARLPITLAHDEVERAEDAHYVAHHVAGEDFW